LRLKKTKEGEVSTPENLSPRAAAPGRVGSPHTCSTAGEGPGWTVRRASACRSWGRGGRSPPASPRGLEPNTGRISARPAVSSPPLGWGCSPPLPALPAAVVQVQQESVVPKFLEGLVVVPVHVACGRATSLRLGAGLGGGSGDEEHPPGARPKKGLGAPPRCLSGGHGHGGDLSRAPPGPPDRFSTRQPPWWGNSGKQSRKNGKGTAAAAGDEAVGSCPSQRMARGQRGEEGAARKPRRPANLAGRSATGRGAVWAPGAPSAVAAGLTHEEIEDCHVDEVEQAMAPVVGRRLSHLSAVVGVQLPPAGRGRDGGHESGRGAAPSHPNGSAALCPPCPPLTRPSCSCGRSGARGCARSGAWPRSCRAAGRPWSPPAGPACRRGRARWSSSRSIPRRSRRCPLAVGTKQRLAKSGKAMSPLPPRRAVQQAAG